MKLILQRRSQVSPLATLGKLSFDGLVTPTIYTLELLTGDGGQGYCIPAGIYNCVPHNTPKHPNTYELLNVPNRTNILVHVGNYIDDTEGCILVGFDVNIETPMLLHSNDAMNFLRRTIGINNSFDIEIVDGL